MTQKNKQRSRPAGWEPVAEWYDGWMGADGGEYHREVAIPAVLRLVDIRRGERILDVGAGQGVLAPKVAGLGGLYTGVDISERLLHRARDRHRQHGRFLLADARRLSSHPELNAGEFDAAIFLLSIQDMQPLEQVLKSASWALKPGGRLVILMTHPCFRIPRQSGWNWDGERKLRYRRIDHYLTPLSVPMKPYPGQPRGVTLSFHRPLEDYINGLADCGLLVDMMQEIPTHKQADSRADNRANQEIPLFMALRARKLDRTA